MASRGKSARFLSAWVTLWNERGFHFDNKLRHNYSCRFTMSGKKIKWLEHWMESGVWIEISRYFGITNLVSVTYSCRLNYDCNYTVRYYYFLGSKIEIMFRYENEVNLASSSLKREFFIRKLVKLQTVISFFSQFLYIERAPSEPCGKSSRLVAPDAEMCRTFPEKWTPFYFW